MRRQRRWGFDRWLNRGNSGGLWAGEGKMRIAVAAEDAGCAGGAGNEESLDHLQ